MDVQACIFAIVCASEHVCVSDSSGSSSLSVLIRHAAVTIERKGVGGWRCMRVGKREREMQE